MKRRIVRFYGLTENSREVARDMREMTDRVKEGKPLYGKTEMSDYMQGVAARNSRYTGIFLHVMPMFNFVNHNQVCRFRVLMERVRWSSWQWETDLVGRILVVV